MCKKLKICLVLIAISLLHYTPAHAVIQIQSVAISTVLHFGNAVINTFKNTNQKEQRVNLNNTDQYLSILQISYKNLGQTLEDSSLQGQLRAQINDDSVIAKVIGPALCYPNPFQQETGTRLGYQLSKNMDIEIHVYDMLANLIMKKDFAKGSIGGREGLNKVDIDLNTWDQYILSAGVYFYLLINNGKVLSKGKMAIIP